MGLLMGLGAPICKNCEVYYKFNPERENRYWSCPVCLRNDTEIYMGFLFDSTSETRKQLERIEDNSRFYEFIMEGIEYVSSTDNKP